MAVIEVPTRDGLWIERELSSGLAHQGRGDLHLAWSAYRRVLEHYPENPDALNLMGVVAAEMGDHARAIHYLERAIRSHGRIAGYHLNLARVYLRLDNLDKAAHAAERALQLDPLDPHARRELGMIALRRNLTREGLKQLHRAFTVNPHPAFGQEMIETLIALDLREEAIAFAHRCIKILSAAELHYALGNACCATQEWPAAQTAYESALALRPAYPEALCNLARVRRVLGNAASALELYQRAIAIAPALPEAHLSLGVLRREAGDLAGAEAAYRQALAARPDWALAHFNLGNVLRERAELPAAIEQYRRCVALDGRFVLGWINLGNALRARKNFDEAKQCYDMALSLDPSGLEAQLNLGNVLRDLDRLEEAVAVYRKVTDRFPDRPQAHNNLGVALRELGQVSAARAACERAIGLAPDYADAHYNLGTTWADEGEARTAMASYQRALELDPALLEAHSNVLMSAHQAGHLDGAGLRAVHEGYFRAHSEISAAVSPPRPRPYARGLGRLRVGYVSSDLRRHSVAWFAEPVLAHHDKSRFEVLCYHNHPSEDEVSARFKGYADAWVACAGLSDAELARRIEHDGVDVLIDLNGHTAGNRLLSFARACAPVQMTWLGYPGSTGLSSMHYRITDWQVDPRGYEAYNTERLLRLPASYFCYRAPAQAPEVGPLPMDERGQVTFGSFNNLAKVSEVTLKMWSRVLAAVPGSRLLLKAKALADEGVRGRLWERLAAQGVAASRVELSGWEADTRAHLAHYNEVDIALDTWPYNGATTTCEALWMGVPVVSLCGPLHASRMGLSILRAAGLVAHVEYDDNAFVARCAELARERARLARFRASARERLRNSALMDETAYTRAFELAIEVAQREMGV